MPTASTAQILGNNESIEPYTSNIYSRRVLSGEFQVVNKHLLRDLTELGLWDDNMKNTLIAHNGSVQVTFEGFGFIDLSHLLSSDLLQHWSSLSLDTFLGNKETRHDLFLPNGENPLFFPTVLFIFKQVITQT